MVGEGVFLGLVTRPAGKRKDGSAYDGFSLFSWVDTDSNQACEDSIGQEVDLAGLSGLKPLQKIRVRLERTASNGPTRLRVLEVHPV